MTNEKTFSLPRGTADVLPPESCLWQDLETKARQCLSLYNYQEIRTPLFEEAELFARSMGATSDIVQKQMLTLSPNQREGESGKSAKSYALRPEGTAAIVRSYIENALDKKESLSKLFYIGPMFRGERPQKGRLRQFHQVGAEALGPGSASPLIDAELIALSADLLNAFGLKDYVINLNSLGTPEDKERFAKLLKEKLAKQKDALCPTCQERFDRNVFRILDCKDPDCQKVVKQLSLRGEYLSKESTEYYDQVKKALGRLGIKYQEAPTLVRGLDYYTQTVFEITSADLGSQDALGAGGRYNHLVEELGGPKGIDAVGFSLGIERVLIAAKADAAAVKGTLDAYIIALGDDTLAKAFDLLNDLRRSGIKSDMNYRAGSMKSQMRSADKSGTKLVIILGEDEIKKGAATIKDMRSGEQKEIPFDRIVKTMKDGLC